MSLPSPQVIELDKAQEYGLGGNNSYWDLQKNISVGFGRGEILFLFGDRNTRLIYKGGEGGGFMAPAGVVIGQFPDFIDDFLQGWIYRRE